MSIRDVFENYRPEVKSANKWLRSNRRHFSRNNRRKKTSPDYIRKFRKLVLSRHSGDKWIPCPSGYTRGQGWNYLFHAWIGFKRANNPKNGESFQDKLYWAQTIQNIQTDMGLQRSSFPQLGLLGDVVFLYDQAKQWELEDLHEEQMEEWKKNKEKEKREHVKDIVNASYLTEEEVQLMSEDSIPTVVIEHLGPNLEKVTMVNIFDILKKNYHD